MEENNIVGKNEQTDIQPDKAHTTEKKSKSKKDSKKDFSATLTHKFNEYKGEFKKIIWPSQKDLYKQTITVIVISIIVGALIFLMDSAYGFGYSWIVKLVSQSF